MTTALTQAEAQSFLTAQLAANEVGGQVNLLFPGRHLVYSTGSDGVVVEHSPGEHYATLKAFARAYGLSEEGT